jgi:hypothetical protein
MTSSNEATQTIARLIKASCPIIGVQSHEEGRVLDHFEAIAKAQGKVLKVWSVSQGMQQAFPPITDPQLAKQAHETGLEFTDSVDALQQIVTAAEEARRQEGDHGEPTIFVFKDLHPQITDKPDPVVIRSLRDVAATVPYSPRRMTVILLSPTLNIPPDLEKDITVVDFPLPSADELKRSLERFVASLPEGVECNLNGGRQDVIRALQGLTTVEADAVLGHATIAKGHLGTDAIPFILNAKRAIIGQSGALEFYANEASFADIGGLNNLVGWCLASAQSFSPDAQEYGLEPDKGVLIVGVPGCGKSLTAKAIAGETRPLLRLDVGALFGSLVGQSEAQTRQALKVAEAVAPCVLWIDEIEKALGGSGSEMDGGTSLRVLGTILTWMQETAAPVFVVATANDVGSLRPELIRRFSEMFFVDVPQTAGECAEILAIHLRKRKRDGADFDLQAVGTACASKELTGAEIEKVVQNALRQAFMDSHRPITTEDLLTAVAQMVPMVTSMREQVQAMRAWSARALPASTNQTTGRTAPLSRTRQLEI